MRHFDYNTSKKMAELGCRSNNTERYDVNPLEAPPERGNEQSMSVWPKFLVQDFLDTTEQARKNCEALNSGKYVCNECGRTLDKTGCFPNNTDEKNRRHSFSVSGWLWIQKFSR